MLQEAIDYIHRLGQAVPNVITVHDNGETATKLVTRPSLRSVDGKPVESPISEILKYPKAPAPYHARIDTIPSLLRLLGDIEPEDPDPVLYVDAAPTALGGVGAIVADLNPDGHVEATATAPLYLAPEFEALLALNRKDGITQKDLWELLITDLADALPPELLIQVQSLEWTRKGAGALTVNPLGLQEGETSHGYAVTSTTGEAGASTIRHDWTWNGRIWSAYDTTLPIRLRLTLVEGPEGLAFRFYPRRLADAVADHAEHLIEHILEDESTEDVAVYAGVRDRGDS